MKVTYKFLRAGEVEELDEAEVVSGHQVEAGMRHTSTVHVGLLGVARPNTENLITENAAQNNNKHTTVTNCELPAALSVSQYVPLRPPSPSVTWCSLS